MKSLILAVFLLAGVSAQGKTNTPEFAHGAIVRGPTDQKLIALEFTGDEFGEGASVILGTLARRGAKASFFLTGRFLGNPTNEAAVRRLVRDGHYLGAHSDAHPLYCAWTNRNHTLVTKEFFESDLTANFAKMAKFGVARERSPFWIAPYEHFNDEISQWSKALGLTLINFTPGTRSATDYLPDDAPSFIPSQKIVDSILDYERKDAAGLKVFCFCCTSALVRGGRTNFMTDWTGFWLNLKHVGIALCGWTSFYAEEARSAAVSCA